MCFICNVGLSDVCWRVWVSCVWYSTDFPLSQDAARGHFSQGSYARIECGYFKNAWSFQYSPHWCASGAKLSTQPCKVGITWEEGPWAEKNYSILRKFLLKTTRTWLGMTYQFEICPISWPEGLGILRRQISMTVATTSTSTVNEKTASGQFGLNL